MISSLMSMVRCPWPAHGPTMVILLGVLWIFAGSARAQQPPPPPGPQTPSPSTQPPQFAQQVDVVAVTPIHGVGLSKLKVPANVQVFSAEQVRLTVAPDVATLLKDRAAGVYVSDAQGGTFQPDLAFRGFVASPLLGASEGLAVYQDGVRVNEAFGDTVNWDALPAAAIASINLTPGSNPMFGLNALGGALSVRTKDGFAFPGRRASLTGGSFGRYQVDAEFGVHGESLGYFVAGSLTDEGGWRDFSPSTIRRLFGAVTRRSAASSLNLSVTAASNDLTGNGPAPVQLLVDEPSAVFTHPDRTDNDLVLVTLNLQRIVSATTMVDAVAYYRHSGIGTFNGDAAGGDEENETGGSEGKGEDDEFDAVNNISDTRANGGGVTAQVTRTTPLLGRSNHFIAGGGLDAASTEFDFATEWAYLTPSRGTEGSGVFDEDAFVDLHNRTMTASAFVSNTWSVTDDLSITGSGRANWTAVELRDQIGTALSGDHRFRRLNASAGATYQFRRELNLYASYAQSSRVPTPVELTCANPDDPCRLPNAFVSDPPLEQIVAGTWEAGVRVTSGGASWTLSAFRTAARDDIIFVSSGTLRGEGHFENVDRTHRGGLEATVDYSVPNRVSTFATYSLQRATFETDLTIASQFHPLADDGEIVVPAGSRMPGVPTHSAKLGLSAYVTAGLTLGATIRAQSAQYLRGDEANLLAELPGFAVVNAQARQRINRRLTGVAEVQNLLGAEYYTFGVLGDAGLLGETFEDDPRFYSPGAPRALWVGLEVRF